MDTGILAGVANRFLAAGSYPSAMDGSSALSVMADNLIVASGKVEMRVDLRIVKSRVGQLILLGKREAKGTGRERETKQRRRPFTPAPGHTCMRLEIIRKPSICFSASK